MTAKFHNDILRKLFKSDVSDYSITLIINKPDLTGMLSGMIIESMDGNKITLDDDDKITTAISIDKIIEIKKAAENHYYITVI